MKNTFRTLLMQAGATALVSAACIQVGPKDDEPLHIVLDVNIRVQIDESVTDFWDSVERQAEAPTPEEQP